MSLQRRGKRCCVVNERQVTIRRKTRRNRINNKCIKVRVLRAKLKRLREDEREVKRMETPTLRKCGTQLFSQMGRIRYFPDEPFPFCTFFLCRAVSFSAVFRKNVPLKCVGFRGFANCIKCQSVQAGKHKNQSHQDIIKTVSLHLSYCK